MGCPVVNRRMMGERRRPALDKPLIDWGLLGQQAGLGFILGLAVGYSVKKAVKVLLLMVGVLTAILVALSRAGFVTVDWSAIERAYAGAVQQTGGAKGTLDRIIVWFSSSIAAAGSFTLGFWVGLKKG